MALSIKRISICTSIGLNALCAGGILTFPLLCSALAAQFHLTQPQLTTVVLAGMMSQYTVAALVGSIIDNYGPSICSLTAALLFICGFGGFAFETRNPPTIEYNPSQGTFYRLTFYFFLAGLGTVFSYFSSLFAASKAFPGHIGFASGSSLALFGLSPLFLSLVSARYFTSPETGFVKLFHYMAFLAAFAGSGCFLGFIILRQVPVHSANALTTTGENASNQRYSDGETRPLLDHQNESSNSDGDHATVKQLLKNQDFWFLAIFCVFILGVSEMIISNIGTIVISLPPGSEPAIGGLMVLPATHQVNLIAISNTVARITVGPLADFISPAAAYPPTRAPVFPRKYRISRFVFLAGPAVLLNIVFAYMEFFVVSQSHIWVLSVGTALAYSTVFTILPSLISSLWGVQNMGRNFGLMMYAPFTGNPLFSYLYAFVSSSNSSGGICVGRPCWELTFWLAIVTSSIALLISLILWRKWRGRL